jgi:subtilisin-like proprotein convertase family protein
MSLVVGLAVMGMVAGCGGSGGDDRGSVPFEETDGGVESDVESRRDAESCRDGTRGCGCYGNGTCDPGLACVSGTCLEASDAAVDAGSGGDANTIGDVAERDGRSDVPADAGAPTIAFRSPSDGAELTGETTVALEVSENVEQVEIALNGESETTLSSAPFEWTWKTGNAEPGQYEVSATAENGAGRTASASIDVSVRRTCPSDEDCHPTNVDILYPSEGDEVCGTISVRATAEDDRGIERIDFAVDGQSLGSATSAPYRAEWATTDLADGEHRLRATARDTSGQTFFATTTVQVDNSGDTCDNRPYVHITSPEAGAVLGGTVTVAVDTSDDTGVTGVQLFLDNKLVGEQQTVPYEFQFDASQFAGGPHTLKAIATDTSDQTAEHRIDVVVDRSDPMVTLTTPSSRKRFLDPQTISVEAQASDNGSVEEVTFSIGSQSKTISSSPWRASLDVSMLSGGATTVSATARDGAGRTGTASQTVDLDRPPTVAFTQPAGGATLQQATTIEVQASDDYGLDRVELQSGGKTIGTFQSASGSTYTYDWTPGKQSQGMQTLKAVAVDNQMQTASTTRDVDVQCEQLFYRDTDGDGYGDPSRPAPVATCESIQPPSGRADNKSDCDDDAPRTYPGAAEQESQTACMKDADQDGYGASQPPSGVTAGSDCNDADGSVFKTWNLYRDADEDGFGTGSKQTVCAGSSQPSKWADKKGDCQDGSASINPKAKETCNQKDDNCDGVVDEGCPCNYKGRSTGVCKNQVVDATTGSCSKPGAYESTEQSCDGKDNDCDGQVDGRIVCATAESENNDPSLGGSADTIQLGNNGEVSFKGTLEAPRDFDGDQTVEQDVDVFEFTAKRAGQWFEISIESTGIAGVTFRVRGPNGWSRLGLLDTPVSTRQIVVPKKGDYTIEVQPIRSVLNSNVGPFGGSNWTYVGTVDELKTPSGRTLDPTQTDATGSIETLTDNFYQLQGVQAGDLVQFRVDALGSGLRKGRFQLWNGRDRVVERTIAQGDAFTLRIPKAQSTGSLHLLVDAVAVTGPDDGFTISGSKRSNVEALGSITAGGRAVSNAKTLSDGQTRYYTFSAKAGEVLEIQQTNGANRSIAYELRESPGETVDRDDSLPVDSQVWPKDGYYFTDTGGNFVLEVTADEGRTPNLEVTVDSITPSSLGSGKAGDTITKTIADKVERNRSSFHVVEFKSRVQLDGTFDALSPNVSGNDVYFYDADYDSLFSELGSNNDTLSLDPGDQIFEPGRYVVRIEGDEALNKYKIALDLLEAPKGEKEPNDTTGQARKIALDERYVGRSQSGDPDVYALDLGSDLGPNETLVIHVDGDFERDTYDCRLLDGNGKTLNGPRVHGRAVARDYGCTLLAGGLQKGRYYVELDVSAASSIQYELAVRRKTGTNESEPNETTGKATSIRASNLDGANVYGSLRPKDTTDVFSFDVPQQLSNQSIRVSLEELGPDLGADLDWALLDANQNTVASSGGTSIAIQPGAGTYYLELSASKAELTSANGEDGEYKATLKLFDGVYATPNASIPDDDASGVSSSLKLQNCATLQKLEVLVSIEHAESEELQIELTNPGGRTIVLQANALFGSSDFGAKLYPTEVSPEGGTFSSTFYGRTGTGDWTIRVADQDADTNEGIDQGEGGTLRAWGMSATCK